MWLACAGAGVAGLLPLVRGAPPGREGVSPGPAPQPVSPAALAHAETAEPPLRVEVTGISRISPDVIEIRLAVTNLAAETSLDLGDRFAEGPDDRGSLSAAYLTTEQGTARYFVLRDSEGLPVGSRDLETLAAGERRDAWIRFTAPDRPAARVSLQLAGVPPLGGLDVPEAP
jgi:hypothetical protein